MLIFDTRKKELTYDSQLIYQIYWTDKGQIYPFVHFWKQGLNIDIADFPDIYDVQMFTMICINYRSVNVERERKASPPLPPTQRMLWSVSTKHKDVRIG